MILSSLRAFGNDARVGGVDAVHIGEDSQRSALSAAASATAEVSEPPRPSVVIRLSGPTPWKPATTGTSPAAMRRVELFRVDALRCGPCHGHRRSRIGICQPSQERAVTPSSCRASAISPAVTCSPEATTASYSRASCSGAMALVQPTSWLVAPAMAETTTATWWPASTSRLTRGGDRLGMRSTSATEVPPNFMHDAGLAGRSRHRSESWGMLAAAPRPLPDGRRVSILIWDAAKQGLRK